MTERATAKPFEIGLLQSDQLDAYKALRDAMLDAHPDAYTSDAETERQKSAADYRVRLGSAVAEGGHFTLAAWDADAMIGAISVERDLRPKVRHIAHVVGMMVLPSAQGCGVGRALLQACMHRARLAHGLEMLTLSVTASNHRAVALYEHHGFVRFGTLPCALKLGDRNLDKHHMACTL